MESSHLVLEELTAEECTEHLASAHVGRVVLSSGAIPVALPVNFAMLDDDIVFATAPGSKLQAAAHGNVVSVEIDGIDPLYHTGWSVLATGIAREVVDPVEIEKVRRLPLQPWAPSSDRQHFVRVATQLVTGRRIVARPFHDDGDPAGVVDGVPRAS